MHRYADQSLLALHPKNWRVQGLVQYLWRGSGLQLITYLITVNRYKVFSMPSAWPSTSTDSERYYLCWYLKFPSCSVCSNGCKDGNSLLSDEPVKKLGRSAKIDTKISRVSYQYWLSYWLIYWLAAFSFLTAMLNSGCILINIFWMSSTVEHFNPLGWLVVYNQALHYKFVKEQEWHLLYIFEWEQWLIKTSPNQVDDYIRETVINYAVTISKCLTSNVSE